MAMAELMKWKTLTELFLLFPTTTIIAMATSHPPMMTFLLTCGTVESSQGVIEGLLLCGSGGVGGSSFLLACYESQENFRYLMSFLSDRPGTKALLETGLRQATSGSLKHILKELAA